MTPTLQAQVHSPELERAVLGVLLDGRHQALWSVFMETCGGPGVFFMRNHRVVALALAALIDAGSKANSQTVITRLQTMPWFQTWQALKVIDGGQAPKAPSEKADLSESALVEIGGPNTVFEIQNAGGAVGGFAENCRMLASYQAQRQMVAILADASDAANAVDGQRKLAEIADRAINRLAALVMARDQVGTISEAMRKAITRNRSAGSTEPRPTPSWGLAALDRALPLRAARMVIIAAAPGHGKSSLALQAAVATAAELGDQSVAMVNLEMPPEQIGAILLGRAIGTPTKTIEQGHLGQEQAEHAERVIAERAAADIHLRTSHKRLTIDDLCAWIRQRHVRSAGKLSLVVIDYLQLIDGKGRMTEYERVSEASRALKLLANDLRVCLLVLSQLSREGTKADRDTRGNLKGNPEPRLADLRGSGSIEQDADAVVFIWPPNEGETPDLDVFLKIGKNRGGPTTRRDAHIHAVFERANGQVFRQVSAPASIMAQESSRAHHNHPPSPAEDGWADRALPEPA